MTKILQDRILHQLNFLKSIGYEYIDNINFNEINKEQDSLPNNMKDLEEIVNNCYLCQLSKYRENVLFGYGNINSKVMFLKESPGITEDEMNQFYVGKSGNLLANMIEKVLNVSCADVYITNIVKCISTNNQVSIEHVNYCRSYLDKQIELIKPKLIVTLGELAYNYFTNDSTSFNEIRGKVISNNNYDVICTYEPSFLLRNPSSKKEAYQDMLTIKNIMERI